MTGVATASLFEGVRLAATLLYGGSMGDNAGAVVGVAVAPEAAPWLERVRLEAGVGYLRYLTVTAALAWHVELGAAGDGGAPARLVLGAGWAYDRDDAGPASLAVHHLFARVAVEAPLGGRWYVVGELVPVRFPVDATADGGRDVPVDATDAVLFSAGVGIGARF